MSAQYPCRGCVYYNECGNSNRTMPCAGRTTKSQLTPYERIKRAVYATGNKWAIENFHATHD